MIPVPKLGTDNEPPFFAINCRAPGKSWLAEYPDRDPHEKSEWWSQFQPDLARHFNYRCGWLGVSIELDGIVEHWLSCGPRKGLASPHRDLAFEWSNYRYATGVINSLKGTLDDQVMDPCEVKDGWFEVTLPSFELVATDDIPESLRDKAQTTLKELQLRRHKAQFTRWRWYQRYWNSGNPDVAALKRDAPLVAAAVEKAQAAAQPLPDPATCEPGYVIEARQRRYAPRRRVKAAAPVPITHPSNS
jgi:hypothetical protein